MCGIAGVFIEKYHRDDWGMGLVQDSLMRMHAEGSSRGNHAAGIAAIRRTDGRTLLLKKKMSSAEMVGTPDYQKLLGAIDRTMGIVLCHARFATKGSPNNPVNNHPIVAGSAIGIHNGVLINTDALFRKFGLERKYEVDSEVFVRMTDAGFLEEGLNSAVGSAAIVMVDRRVPTKAYVFFAGRPFAAAYSRKLRVMLWASCEWMLHLERSLGMDMVPVPLEPKTLYTFDINRLPKPVKAVKIEGFLESDKSAERGAARGNYGYSGVRLWNTAFGGR